MIIQKKYFEIQQLKEFRILTTANQLRSKEMGLYDLVWVKDGNAELITNCNHYAQHDVMYCFRPGHLRQIIDHGGSAGFHIVVSEGFLYTSGCNVHFILSASSNGGTEPVIISMNEETRKNVADLLLKMKSEYSESLQLHEEITQGLFNIFLLYLSRSCGMTTHTVNVPREVVVVSRFFQLLTKSHKVKKQVKQYAGELNLSPNYLNQLIKKITGFCASHHIQQPIISQAKKHALQGSCSMKEVAYELGFESMAHFSKFFKTNSGINFTHFKRHSFLLSNSSIKVN